VGAVYNFAVQVRNDGTTPIELLSASVRRLPDGLDAVPSLLGYNCGAHREVPAFDVGADLVRTRVNIDLTALSARPVTPSGSRYCYYALIRLVPARLGDHVTREAVIRYRAGRRTYTARFPLVVTVRANATGPDPEDRYDPMP